VAIGEKAYADRWIPGKEKITSVESDISRLTDP
jgi:hypothetical protein